MEYRAWFCVGRKRGDGRRQPGSAHACTGAMQSTKGAAGMARETGQPGQGRATAFTETELKICELCGWLNLESNEECFVCGWHGRFEQDPELVRAAVELAVRRYGRLELQHLTDLRTYRQP